MSPASHHDLQLNLFLAVLKSKFAKAKNLLDEKRRHRRAMKGARDPKKQNILMRSGGWFKSELPVKSCTYYSTKVDFVAHVYCCLRQ